MRLENKVEALLFASDSPVTSLELAKTLGVEEQEVALALEALAEDYRQNRGLQILRIAGGYQISTKPELAEIVARHLRPTRNKLSRSQLEVLAIVAYQQPVTMAEIDAVRGVQSDHSLRALMDRRLVCEVGRRPTPGRPLLYGTSDQFLHLFHLNDLGQLPPLSLPAPGSESVESAEQPS